MKLFVIGIVCLINVGCALKQPNDSDIWKNTDVANKVEIGPYDWDSDLNRTSNPDKQKAQYCAAFPNKCGGF